MRKLIEAIFGLLRLCLEASFSFLAFLFGTTLRNGKAHSAGFMPFWKRKSLLSKSNSSFCADGIRQLNSRDTTNTLIIGKSGSGKSTINYIPSVMRTNDSFIITDVDGDIYNKTTGHLKKKGYDIQGLNLKDVYKSISYNPLDFCKTDSDLKKLAKIIISTAYPNARGSDAFWNAGGEAILYIFLRILHRGDPEFKNFYNLRGLLLRYSMAESFVSANATEEIWNDYLGFSSADPKIVSGQVSSALTALDGMAEQDLIHLTSKNTLDLSKLSKGKGCLFIIVPEVKMMQYSFLTSILYAQIFDYFQLYKSPRKIQCFMDEFGIQKIPDFPSIINYCRRYNLSCHLGVQDIKQLHSNYGADETSMLINGGCSTKIIYSGMGLELARDLSMTIGRTSYKVKEGKHMRTHTKELLSIQELIQLKDRSILIHKNLPPYLMKYRAYYRQGKLRRLSKLPPIPFPVSEASKRKLIPLSITSNPFEDEK